MTDLNATVPDDETGSLEDRPCAPLSSTKSTLVSNGEGLFVCESNSLTPSSGNADRDDSRNCDTKLYHRAVRENDPSHCSITDSGFPACSTRLYHHGASPASATKAAKPSGNGSIQPSSKRSARTPRSRHCGLIIRGEVYYLRVKVPRHLQAQIGHSPPKAGYRSF